MLVDGIGHHFGLEIILLLVLASVSSVKGFVKSGNTSTDAVNDFSRSNAY